MRIIGLMGMKRIPAPPRGAVQPDVLQKLRCVNVRDQQIEEITTQGGTFLLLAPTNSQSGSVRRTDWWNTKRF